MFVEMEFFVLNGKACVMARDTTWQRSTFSTEPVPFWPDSGLCY